MGYYPCDCHGSRYVGPQQTAYPALLTGSDSKRERRRLCRACFADLLRLCTEYLLEVGVDDDKPLDACSFCSSPETTTMAFATVYETREARRDFVGRVCAGCLPGTEMAFFGSQAGLLPISA